MGVGCVPQIAFERTGAASSINAACYVRKHLVVQVRADDGAGAGRRQYTASGGMW